jgi:hypothetical protein
MRVTLIALTSDDHLCEGAGLILTEALILKNSFRQAPDFFNAHKTHA